MQAHTMNTNISQEHNDMHINTRRPSRNILFPLEEQNLYAGSVFKGTWTWGDIRWDHTHAPGGFGEGFGIEIQSEMVKLKETMRK